MGRRFNEDYGMIRAESTGEVDNASLFDPHFCLAQYISPSPGKKPFVP